jgi:Fe-S oxidoreductase
VVKAAAAYGVGQDIGTYVSVISGPSRFDLGESLLDVLEREGVEVITFPDEACCGIPALMSGDESAARKMAAAPARQSGNCRACWPKTPI